jgi:hypothetical protein
MQTGGMSASAGSRKAGYGAESVMEIGKKEGAATDAEGADLIELLISKNRHGSPGRRVTLRWRGALQSYEEAWR